MYVLVCKTRACVYTRRISSHNLDFAILLLVMRALFELCTRVCALRTNSCRRKFPRFSSRRIPVNRRNGSARVSNGYDHFVRTVPTERTFITN